MNAKAIVQIGAIGGIAMGLALIIIDILLMGYRNINNGGDVQRKGKVTKPVDYRRGVMEQAFIRAMIWPGLAAASGVVGAIL
jgi:hypothetical protein